MYKTILLLGILMVGSLGLTACNTVEGIGADIEQAGRNISDAVD